MASSVIKNSQKLGRFFAAAGLLFFSMSDVHAKEPVLVLRPAAESFTEVVQGMRAEMEDELDFLEVNVDEKTDVSVVVAAIKEKSPKAVVLIGNSAINVYLSFQNQNPQLQFPPSVALAALFIDKFAANLKNSSGIKYEIPAVTSAIALRGLVREPFKKVGVIYRQWMAGTINENSRYLKAENIELVGVQLLDKEDDMPGKVKGAIKSLLDQKVNAIWILNDNELLNQKVLVEAWLPSLASAPVSVIVGVKPLVATKIGLGTFAVVPDHYGLGVQAASMLSDIMEDDWVIDQSKVEQPLSVKKIVNTRTMEKKGIQFQSEKLNEMDESIRQ